MFTESELRTMAQDVVIALVHDAPDTHEVPYTWSGQYIVLGSVPSRFPWNGDLLGRSFDEKYEIVAFYLDHSVPGAGFGQWYARRQDGQLVAGESIVDLAAEFNLAL